LNCDDYERDSKSTLDILSDIVFQVREAVDLRNGIGGGA
jgi:hypothetical protein